MLMKSAATQTDSNSNFVEGYVAGICASTAVIGMATYAMCRAYRVEVIEEIKSTDDMAKLDQKFADYSDDFIRRSAKEQQPFFLIHAFSRLHNDNYPAPGYAGKSPAAFPYKDAVVEVDDIVGRIMATIRETGQLENTFVFLASDNGANEDVWPDGS